MATDDLNFEDIEEVITAIKAAGVKYVSTDPAEVNTPGVWVRFDGLSAGTLASLGVNITLHVVVANANDRTRTNKALAETFNKVKDVVNNTYGGPSGPIVPVGLVLPVSQSPLPCLQIPVALLTTN